MIAPFWQSRPGSLSGCNRYGLESDQNVLSNEFCWWNLSVGEKEEELALLSCHDVEHMQLGTDTRL